MPKFLPNPPRSSFEVLPWFDRLVQNLPTGGLHVGGDQTTTSATSNSQTGAAFLVSSALHVAPGHPGLASCQTCHSARVSDMVSVTLGKLGLGQARLLPRLPQRLTTVHVRVVS